MKKRYKVLSIILAASVTATVSLAGCSLVSPYSQADMQQVIAEVNIGNTDKLSDELAPYAGAITSSTSIYKRDLVAYFLNSGGSLIQTGVTYGEAFQTLFDTLVNNEILIQYATLSTLKSMVDENYNGLSDAQAAVDWFNGFKTDAERYNALLTYQAEKDEEDLDYKMVVEYRLKTSINNAIDSYEEQDTEVSAVSSATVPGGVDTEEENYYPLTAENELDYNVYTGWNGYLLSESGIYQDEALEKTTLWSRRKAYNSFIEYLDANYLIEDGEDIRDVWNLSYVQEEYVSMLRQQMLSNYYTLYRNELEEDISSEYLSEKYQEMLIQQKSNYENAPDDFLTAMSTLNDGSFLLYAPDTIGSENKFGYVYNILLPFSASQQLRLDDYSEKLSNDDSLQNGYYVERNNLLRSVKTVDQRDDWFNGGKDYSFDATESGLIYYNNGNNSNRLFFENNIVDANNRYQDLERYLGLYPYNGKAIKNSDDSYTLIPNKLSIDNMLSEFTGYVNFALDSNDSVTWNYWADGNELTSNNDVSVGNTAYYEVSDFYGATQGNGNKPEIDYSKFIYAAGKVSFSDFAADSIYNEQSDCYKAMSAVNELQYAYTTDTGVLSQYIGYNVGAYSTNYIKEFEYAAQQAIRGGAGSFIVCAGDYGWHLIYVTYVFEGDEVYNVDWSRMNTEGTFEYEFYQSVKSSELTTATTKLQSSLLLNLYQKDSSVNVYEDKFSDLTSLTTTSNTTSNING